MEILWQIAIPLVALWGVFRFVQSQFAKISFREKTPPNPLDPRAGVRAPNKGNPGNRSGAVALAEPDEDDEDRSFPP